MASMSNLVEEKKKQIQAKLDELNKFEREVVKAMDRLSLQTLKITDDVRVVEIRSQRIQGYDQVLSFDGKVAPSDPDQLGQTTYWWGQFECPIEFLTVQELSHYHAQLPELRQAFSKAIEAL
jgi:hypothetical protein